MDALIRRRAMMLGGAPRPPQINYLICGSPTIEGMSYIPDTTARGFIYTNKPFNPDTSSWIIQTKIKLNSAVAWKDFISSVNENGERQYSILCQTNTESSNKGYSLFLSNNGTSWDLSNAQPRGTMGTDAWRIFQIVCTRSDVNYIYKMGYPETSSWTGALSKVFHPKYGYYISFGGGFANSSPNCEIDLSETKIWVNNTLWWEAVTL